MPCSLQVSISEASIAQFSAPSSLPANRAFFRFRAIARLFCHVGQSVEVHYRWHPLYGRRVRWRYSEQRVAGQVVHIEALPGVVTAIAAWMLDPVACAGMETIGALRVAISALFELHHLLIERGFRRSSRDNHGFVTPSVCQQRY